MAANVTECKAAGIDPAAVNKIAKRLELVMKDAGKLGISLFCGGSNSLRARDGGDRTLIIAHLAFNNADGGDGGCDIGDDGLLRGE